MFHNSSCVFFSIYIYKLSLFLEKKHIFCYIKNFLVVAKDEFLVLFINICIINRL